jgi:hypothetical protein
MLYDHSKADDSNCFLNAHFLNEHFLNEHFLNEHLLNEQERSDRLSDDADNNLALQQRSTNPHCLTTAHSQTNMSTNHWCHSDKLLPQRRTLTTTWRCNNARRILTV